MSVHNSLTMMTIIQINLYFITTTLNYMNDLIATIIFGADKEHLSKVKGYE